MQEEVKYELPPQEEVVVSNKGEVLDKKNLTPFQIIKLVAAQNQIEINDPNPSCKHCYGRGYLGVEHLTKKPVPCSCVFPEQSLNQKVNDKIVDAKFLNGNPNPNRKQRREYDKILKKEKNKKNGQKT